MLNKNNERELAYFARVTNIAPMDAERLECIYINGWTCVASKGEFKVGDLGVFFEPDSKLPDVAPFNEIEFLKKKDYKIKPQKIRGVVSQGLFMPLSAFGWVLDDAGTIIIPPSEQFGKSMSFEEHDFLTEYLKVTYEVVEDNQRKASTMDKYKKMAQRRPSIFKKKWARWMMRREWGRKVMFFFFGKKKDKRNSYPSWVVKTDEERAQNLPYLFPNCPTKWIATEKVDGTSTTFSLKGFGRKKEYVVCSRNVCFDSPEKMDKCFYDSNVYLEMSEKYHMSEALENALKMEHNRDSTVEFVTIQGETYGGNIQKRNYGDEHRLAIFNVIIGHKDGTTRRLNPMEMRDYLPKIQPKCDTILQNVPIVDEEFYLPNTCDELLKIAHGDSAIDGKPREGLVFRSCDGVQSFKAVDPEFLVKFHA